MTHESCMASFKYLSESQFVIIHSKLTEVDQVNPTSWKISNACPTILYSTCFPFGFFSSLFFFFGSRFRVLAWIISSPGTRGYSHVSSFFPTNARWWYALYLGSGSSVAIVTWKGPVTFKFWQGISLPDFEYRILYKDPAPIDFILISKPTLRIGTDRVKRTPIQNTRYWIVNNNNT
jgi:hypothetical protein